MLEHQIRAFLRHLHLSSSRKKLCQLEPLRRAEGERSWSQEGTAEKLGSERIVLGESVGARLREVSHL